MVKPWKQPEKVVEDGACASGASASLDGTSADVAFATPQDEPEVVAKRPQDIIDGAICSSTVIRNDRTVEQHQMRSRSLDIGRGSISLIELMVQSPEDVLCSQDQDGDNELMIAIIKRLDPYAIFIIDVLVSRKQKKLLDIRNSLGQSALHLAVIVDIPMTTKALVKAGVTLDLRDKNGRTPLHCACAKGLLRQVDILTSNGDKSFHKKLAESVDYQGWNCIHLATRSSCTIVIEHLVKRIGVDINKQGGSRGMTALHFAVMVQDITMVLFLLHIVKANVNALTYDNWSPLEFAMGFRHDWLVQPLIQAGGSEAEYLNFTNKLTMLDEAVSTLDDDMDY